MADLMDGWEEDQEDDADGYSEPAPAVGGGMGDEDLEDDEGFDDDYDDEDDGIGASYRSPPIDASGNSGLL